MADLFSLQSCRYDSAEMGLIQPIQSLRMLQTILQGLFCILQSFFKYRIHLLDKDYI